MPPSCQRAASTPVDGVRESRTANARARARGENERGDYYKLGAEELKRDQRRAEEIEQALTQKLERWESLEGKSQLV
jgi:hypothetical protein